MPTSKARRDPEATRQRILAAAADLLAQGDGRLEMSWVSRAAGVSQGLAYHHYGSKEGLLVAVVNDFYDRLENDVLMANLHDIPSWERREATRLQRYIQFMLEDPLGPVVVARLGHTPAVAAVEAARWDQLVSEGARNMAEGQRRGEVSPHESGELLAAMVLGAARAGVSRTLQAGASVDGEQLARDMWRVLRRGLGVSEGDVIQDPKG